MYCKNCGKPIGSNVKYCPHCGAKNASKKDKPVAAYIVSNPSINFEKAQKLIKNTLALGIVDCVSSLWLVILFIFMAATASKPNVDEAFAVISALFIEGCGIASLVLTIIIWARWRAIKENTKVSHLWATVGYSVDLGASFVLLITYLVIGNMNGPVGVLIALLVIIACIEIFNIFISFYLHHKIKTTIHK